MVTASQNNKSVEEAAAEKRYWLKIANACNNNCVFCLDSDKRGGEPYISIQKITSEIDEAVAEGFERLVISGGEASTHPRFVDIVKYASDAGFRRIQTITNGRMFCYESFARQAVNAGLGEVTFSIHGHNAQLHDTLTRVPGSFDQAVKGISNIVANGHCVVNIDVVVNRQNFKHVVAIIGKFSKMNVFEYDLLHVVPFGNAYINRDALFFDIEEAFPYLEKAFSYSKLQQPSYHIWSNRFPPSFLEGNEELIQAPVKLYDEVLGRKLMFDRYLNGYERPCYPVKCSHCFIRNLCARIESCVNHSNGPDSNLPLYGESELSKNREVYLLTTDIMEDLLDNADSIDECAALFEVPAYESLTDARRAYNMLDDVFARFENVPVRNCAPCIHRLGFFEERPFSDYDVHDEDGKLDLEKVVKGYILNDYYLKGRICNGCAQTDSCRGMHINYIRTFGFERLSPLCGLEDA